MEETQPTSGGSKMPFIIIGVIIAVVIIGFAGMNLLTKSTAPEQTMEGQNTTADVTSSPSAAPTGDVMTADTSNEKVITMEAGAFYYSVKDIQVKKGQKVKIIMTAKDMMHDLNIDELNVHSTIAKAGESTTIEFTADTAGTFEYYCSVGQHRKQGQIGKITVTE